MGERARGVVDAEHGGDLPVPRRPSLFLRIGTVAVRVVVTVVSVAVVAAFGYGWWAFSGLDDNVATTDVIDAQPGDPATGRSSTDRLDTATDILLVGIDSRTDAFGNPLPKEVLAMLNGGKADGERNTDTMILVHIPAGGKRAVAFSFPRDSWVDIGGGFGKHKLNSAFVYAYNDARRTLQEQGVHDAKELEAKAVVAGRKNLIATIERLIGKAVTIDRYAEVNLASFYEVTKAVGGVEVCLNNAVDEPKSGARFPAGRQTISGAAALSFVRQRYQLPNGDLDRIVRQQTFLGALANKVLSADLLTDPGRARDLVTAVQKSVVLSSNWNLSRFAAQMQGLSSGNIEFRTIPNQGDAKIGGADVIKVDPEQVAATVKQVIDQADGVMSRPSSTTGAPGGTTGSGGGALPLVPTTTSAKPTGAITVDVRNGSNTKGLAGVVLDRLAGHGFLRGQVGDAAVQRGSVVRYAQGELAKATAVASTLPGTAFTFTEDSTLDTGHVRVVLGTSYGQGTTGESVLNLTPTSTPPPTRSSAGATGTSQPSTVVDAPTVAAGSLKCVN
ncbi:LCP family protein [Actinokineospora globicatena]|uniref:LCP family protein n=1 Tax=Actinokineospora globicatena TaxID=103729 RepID=UPI0020A60B6A|nr:LCP family protein [Actinokineospora globicatena]MCP2302089.1 transcriptional attenuator, LytR family [Actinokineospora globicatena]GLW76249.1 LytTR family transcriptional regulator [Actinokineospora globicatena]GLW83085.1 LytTR family transcriptional regulator [Actinokineospora globicatena]